MFRTRQILYVVAASLCVAAAASAQVIPNSTWSVQRSLITAGNRCELSGDFRGAESNWLRSLTAGEDCQRNDWLMKGKVQLFAALKNCDLIPLGFRKGTLANLCGNDSYALSAIACKKLGNMYLETDRLTSARHAFENAVKWFDNSLLNHSWLHGCAMADLGTVYVMSDQPELGRDLLQKALEVEKKELGGEHPATLSVEQDLANCLKIQGKYLAAEQLYQHSLRTCEQIWGASHPRTSIATNNLASLYSKMGRMKEAETLYRKSLAIDQSEKRHKGNCAVTLCNLASILQDQGRFAEAIPLYLKAAAIYQAGPQKNRHVRASCLNDLATAYHELNRYSQAELYYRQALELESVALGATHPETVQIRNNLVALREGVKGKTSF